jgi:arylsulfatase A-like enzyme
MSTRRGFLKNVVAGAALAQKAPAAPARPLNIVYIHSHDSGRYLSPYGHAVPTVNLRKLASEGVVFRRAFSAAPTCSPSRAALLTGQCPHQNGMLGLAHRGFAMADYKRHIAHTLRGAGYRSVLAGLQHIADRPEKIGYDEVLKPASTHAADVAPQAVAFLNRRPSDPFFLDVGFQETHREYPSPTEEDDPRFILPPAPIPDTKETRQDMAGYHASARNLDRGVGLVLEALERNGLADNTLVISTTDHGIAFPRMKCNLNDAGWGVSLILRGPEMFRGGKVCDAMISQIDLFPTLCEWLKIAPPGWLGGRSFLDVLRGKAESVNSEVYAEVNYHASYEPQRAVRSERYKYIKRFDDRSVPVLPNCDDSPSKALWLDHGWQQRVQPREELYDLVFDPGEQNNLAADRASQQTLKDMRGKLDAWMRGTSDPLLKGQVAAPKGAKVNPVDGISPREPVVDANPQAK